MITVKQDFDFNDLEKECWSGALSTLKTIREHDKEDMFMQMLEETYMDYTPTLTVINDLLWFEDEWIFENLGINPDEDEEEDY